MSPQEQFLKEGLLGAVIVVLSTVVIVLYRENRALTRESLEMAEKRVNDLKQLKDSYFASLETVKDAYTAHFTAIRDIANNIFNVVQTLKERIK